MKRSLFCIAIALVAVGGLVADEEVLIDFANLVPNILQGAEPQSGQNQNTLMDFSKSAGTNVAPEQRSAMITSLVIPEWLVELASSSKSIVNSELSYTRVAQSKEFGPVMGVRVHFPVSAYNSWALIKPPFDIPAYNYDIGNEDGTVSEPTEKPNYSTTKSRFENGYGVVKNVGAIKKLQVRVYGLNFPHSLSAIFVDGDGHEHEVFMGYLNQEGWQELTWNNPAYVNQVRISAVRIYPLYPNYAPYIRFAGFRIQRDGSNEGGDFVTYFKDVKVIFDKAQLEAERDVNDEDEWGIINEREAAKQNREAKEFGRDSVLRYLEKQKLAPESEFKNEETEEAGNAGAVN
ncbi:MAG: flagellar filament outer layer protein FlaA [Spirochaetaceae bacterium]|jgi:hypothetical protein|nr:flagellar filament outer layer protein FlaA [Spirochaetaceae bacterium]